MNPTNGTMRALVVSVADPLRLGRVLVRLPGAGSETDVWARVASSPQGPRGAVAVLEVSDEVVVSFAGGDLRNPIVIGALWQGGSPAPTQAGTNPVRRPLAPPVRPRTGK